MASWSWYDWLKEEIQTVEFIFFQNSNGLSSLVRNMKDNLGMKNVLLHKCQYSDIRELNFKLLFWNIDEVILCKLCSLEFGPLLTIDVSCALGTS